MLAYLTRDLIVHLIFFQSLLLAVLLSNLWLLHRARRHPQSGVYPPVSILVPARNEEKNIRNCIDSLLAQDYPAFEIIALDDQSSDNTLAILQELARGQSRLRVLAGCPSPTEHTGKNWACSQLAQQARGEFLFFTDADTVHRPQTLRALVDACAGEQAAFLTGFPRQRVNSWGERLLVPFFAWAALCFIPLWLAYRLRWPALSVAVGQVMFFRREAYQAIGGHASLGPAIVEDFAFARKVNAAGLRWRVVSLADLISCRMYHNTREAVEGFTKNLFAAFDFRLLVFLFVFFWLAALFWTPPLVLAARVLGQAPLASLPTLATCLALALPLWLLPYLEIGLPPALALLYPLTVLANEAVALRSLVFSLTGRLSWKGRALARPRWRWF